MQTTTTAVTSASTIPIQSSTTTIPSSYFSSETCSKWPSLCGTRSYKGTILLLLNSRNDQIYPNGKRTGWHFTEALLPTEHFLSNGYSLQFISETGTAFVDESSVEGEMADSYAQKIWKDKTHPIHSLVGQIKSARDVLPSYGGYVGLYAAGGHGCEYEWGLRDAKIGDVHRLIAAMYERGSVVGLVCHAPSVLNGVVLSNGTKLVSGKKVTGFSTSAENKMIKGILEEWQRMGILTVQQCIETNGGIWDEPKNPMGEHVIVSGRLITGVNPASAKKLAKEMVIMIDKQIELGGPVNYDKIVNKELGGQQLGGQGLGGQHLGGQSIGQQYGSQQLGSQQYGSQTLGSQQLGSQQLGSQQLGSQQLGSQQLGSQQLGSQQLGSQQLGSQQLGSQQLGGQQLGGTKLANEFSEKPSTLYSGEQQRNL